MLVYLIMSQKKKMKENDQITFWGLGVGREVITDTKLLICTEK